MTTPSEQSTSIIMRPIGFVHSSRTTVKDDCWDAVESYIELDARFSSEALMGIDTFSHAEVIFFMNHVEPGKVELSARHPRNNLAWPKVGIFAQRAKNRPNAIGTTICRVLRIDGLRLHVHGLDAVDGSPVLDLKPWVKEFGPRGELQQPAWISELMQQYWE
jgi:tRNA-Thr(GGU) m(6)t(6)A37 methyltransferase TsaA